MKRLLQASPFVLQTKVRTAFLICPLLTTGFSQDLAAQQEDQQAVIEHIEVTGQYLNLPNGTGDASDQLREKGVNFSSAGGISPLPILRGLNDDRVKLLIDGAETTSSCANHMNPALSYIDASRVQSVNVLAGITPVSMGGDSIAGTIMIESEQARYADSPDTLLKSGAVAYTYRSNNHNHGTALNATIASEKVSLSYSGSFDKAESYRDGNGDKVLDTLYRSESHNLTLGMRDEQQSMTLKLNHHEVPYQGFPNQYMDMVGNISNGINFHYLRNFNWGQLDTRLTWQDVDHEMGFFTGEKTGSMPMMTEGRDIAYKIAAEIPLSDDHTLRIGNEFHRFTLDDWWPALEGSMMMGPDDYVNINDGERSRYAVYIESEHALNNSWKFLAGLRYEHVIMDADEVQPYNSMSMSMGSMNVDAPAALAFNASDRHRRDDNFDVTAVLSYTATQNTNIDFGYARKTRSPNLYERYTWGRGTMAMTMIGWFGDANGYVGDIKLEPEIAHILSATLTWHNDNRTSMLTATPYYTYVDNYIDAKKIGTFNPRMAMQVTRPRLQFTNLDAELYGIDINASTQLFTQSKHKVNLTGNLSYTHGERKRDGGDLYHIMPINIKLALEHQVLSWTNRLEFEWVDNKDKVDAIRLENKTGSYTLVNLSTNYDWQAFSITVGISNLFDRNYDLPLGGVNFAGWSAGGKTGQFESLPGQGRSINTGIKYAF